MGIENLFIKLLFWNDLVIKNNKKIIIDWKQLQFGRNKLNFLIFYLLFYIIMKILLYIKLKTIFSIKFDNNIKMTYFIPIYQY